MYTSPSSKEIAFSPAGVLPHDPKYNQGDQSPRCGLVRSSNFTPQFGGTIPFHEGIISVLGISSEISGEVQIFTCG